MEIPSTASTRAERVWRRSPISGETTRSIALFNDASGDEAQYYNIGDMDGLILAGSFLIAYNRTAASFIAHDLGRGLTACSFRYDGPMAQGEEKQGEEDKEEEAKGGRLGKKGYHGPYVRLFRP